MVEKLYYYKGAVEAVLLTEWGAALQEEWVVWQLRSVQRLVALAMTRYYRTTKAKVAFA